MSRASRRARGKRIERASHEREEGQPVAAGTRQIGALRIGLADKSLGIDASRLEAPTQAYDADIAWVDYRPGNVSLFFAKKNRDDRNVLQSRLEIRYPAEDVVNTLWRPSVSFIGRLKTYVQLWPEEARGTDDAATNLPAARSHSEWASFTYMSHSGTEASVDFYSLAPSAIARYAQSQNIEGMKIHPVVRVQMTAFELAAFVERLAPIVGEIERSLPEGHRLASVPEKAG
jgi:hypothetical protein